MQNYFPFAYCKQGTKLETWLVSLLMIMYDWLTPFLLYPMDDHIFKNLFTSLSIQCAVCEPLISGIISGECCLLGPFSVTFLFVFEEKCRNNLKGLLCILGEIQLVHYSCVFSFFVFKISVKTILQNLSVLNSGERILKAAA